jgi:hypothetical protein
MRVLGDTRKPVSTRLQRATASRYQCTTRFARCNAFGRKFDCSDDFLPSMVAYSPRTSLNSPQQNRRNTVPYDVPDLRPLPVTKRRRVDRSVGRPRLAVRQPQLYGNRWQNTFSPSLSSSPDAPRGNFDWLPRRDSDDPPPRMSLPPRILPGWGMKLPQHLSRLLSLITLCPRDQSTTGTPADFASASDSIRPTSRSIAFNSGRHFNPPNGFIRCLPRRARRLKWPKSPDSYVLIGFSHHSNGRVPSVYLPLTSLSIPYFLMYPP